MQPEKESSPGLASEQTPEAASALGYACMQPEKTPAPSLVGEQTLEAACALHGAPMQPEKESSHGLASEQTPEAASTLGYACMQPEMKQGHGYKEIRGQHAKEPANRVSGGTGPAVPVATSSTAESQQAAHTPGSPVRVTNAPLPNDLLFEDRNQLTAELQQEPGQSLHHQAWKSSVPSTVHTAQATDTGLQQSKSSPAVEERQVPPWAVSQPTASASARVLGGLPCSPHLPDRNHPQVRCLPEIDGFTNGMNGVFSKSASSECSVCAGERTASETSHSTP